MSTGSSLPFADAWGMHGDIGAGWWIVMVIAMALFWGAIILGCVWALQGRFDGRHLRKETPPEILERRFAEGEISPDDYGERRQLLRDQTAPRDSADDHGSHAIAGTREDRR